MHSGCLFKLKYKPKRERTRNGCSGYGRSDFRERRTSFCLDFREIRSSKFVGTRKKVALRIVAYAWAPVLRSFDKLREVGDLSYLGFTLYLSVLQCFGCFEAVRGRLIGPKYWDRNVRIFGALSVQSMVV